MHTPAAVQAWKLPLAVDILIFIDFRKTTVAPKNPVVRCIILDMVLVPQRAA